MRTAAGRTPARRPFAAVVARYLFGPTAARRIVMKFTSPTAVCSVEEALPLKTSHRSIFQYDSYSPPLLPPPRRRGAGRFVYGRREGATERADQEVRAPSHHSSAG